MKQEYVLAVLLLFVSLVSFLLSPWFVWLSPLQIDLWILGGVTSALGLLIAWVCIVIDTLE